MIDQPKFIHHIDQVWGRLPIPRSPICIGSLEDEILVEFEGKKYNEVDLSDPVFEVRCPLSYFKKEAEFYYLGSYLLESLKNVVAAWNGEISPLSVSFIDTISESTLMTVILEEGRGDYPKLGPEFMELWELIYNL